MTLPPQFVMRIDLYECLLYIFYEYNVSAIWFACSLFPQDHRDYVMRSHYILMLKIRIESPDPNIVYLSALPLMTLAAAKITYC